MLPIDRLYVGATWGEIFLSLYVGRLLEREIILVPTKRRREKSFYKRAREIFLSLYVGLEKSFHLTPVRGARLRENNLWT